MSVCLSHFYRYTILETGPVETQAPKTAEDVSKAIDHETVDEETKKLEKIWRENYQPLCISKIMDSSKIAAIVKEIILSENNNFRCYTHTDFFSDALTAKLNDSATNKPIEIMRKKLFEKREDESSKSWKMNRDRNINLSYK